MISALFDPVGWIGYLNIMVNYVMGVAWGVVGACAYVGLRHGIGFPAMVLAVASGAYRMTLATDYALYVDSIKFGFQFAPIALIENVAVLTVLVWVIYRALREPFREASPGAASKDGEA